MPCIAGADGCSATASRQRALQLCGPAHKLSNNSSPRAWLLRRPQPRSASPTAAGAADAIQHLNAGRQAIDEGQYSDALQNFAYVLDKYPDYALAEYARVGRALLYYQAGDASRAILELESEEVVLTGYAEVHAALAAILYAERPAQVLRAEQQWTVATSFDTRYGDPAWVRREKHWPPRAVAALERFLSLT